MSICLLAGCVFPISGFGIEGAGRQVVTDCTNDLKQSAGNPKLNGLPWSSIAHQRLTNIFEQQGWKLPSEDLVERLYSEQIRADLASFQKQPFADKIFLVYMPFEINGKTLFFVARTMDAGKTFEVLSVAEAASSEIEIQYVAINDPLRKLVAYFGEADGPITKLEKQIAKPAFDPAMTGSGILSVETNDGVRINVKFIDRLPGSDGKQIRSVRDVMIPVL